MMEIKGSNYHDFSGLAALKKDAVQSPEEAALPVARQFEALFVQMMLKSMRDAVPDGGLFSGDSQKMYTDMLDSQLSVNLSERGGLGLAEVIARQIAGQPGGGETAALNPNAEALKYQLQQSGIQDFAESADKLIGQ